MISLNENVAALILKELEVIVTSGETVSEKISDLSTLFFRIIRTGANSEKVVFKNFYAEFRFFTTQINLSDKDKKNLEGLRLFFKGVKTETLHDEKTYNQIVHLLYKVSCSLQVDSKTAFELKLPDSYLEDFFIVFLPRRNYGDIADVRLLVVSVSQLLYEGDVKYFIIEGFDTENLDNKLTVKIKDYQYTSFSYLHSLIKADEIVQLLNLPHVDSLDFNYIVSHESYIVLQPDYLVDATAIAECFQFKGTNSELFIFSKLITDLSGAAALKGSMVGFFLDEMIRKDGNGDSETFLKAQKENALNAARLGSSIMQEIESSINNEHLPNIRQLVHDESSKMQWIEPTYFSVEYGLQGRIDLLAIDELRQSKDVVELKSGKPSDPAFSVAWNNNRMQVVCYDMMLESTYGSDRNGTNSIFYSQCTVMPRRNIVSENKEKQRVLQIRNEIVAMVQQLAANDFSVLHRIVEKGIAYLPPFSTDAFKEFCKYYIPNEEASAYYEEMLAFTLRELINAKVGLFSSEDDEDKQNGFASLWLDKIFEKENGFKIIYDLRVSEIDESNGYITLSIENDLPHSFRKSDLIVLYPKTHEGNYNALTQHILKGSIKDINEKELVVSLFNKQTDYSFIRNHSSWAIEPDIFERNYWSTISTLFHFLKCSKRKKDLLFGVEEPVFDSNCTYSNEELTENQNSCVCNALAAKDYYLLQGPPGTGKTSTFLIKYLQELLTNPDQKVVILAFTNKAVEMICKNLAAPRTGKPIPYIRIGGKHVEDPYILKNILTGDNPGEWKNLLEQTKVFVSTVASFQNSLLMLQEFMPFKQVIVDEASQLTEADLAGILSVFEKFILIGDHKQLPSVITQREQNCAVKNTVLNQYGINDLRTSLFERLISNAHNKGWEQAYGQLADHYRMHERISDLIKRHYKRPLEASLNRQRSDQFPFDLSPEHPLFELCKSRVVFIETPSEPAPRKNIAEARLAALIAERLVDEKILQASQIGIISPFRAQIVEIKKHLRHDLIGDGKIIIDTVERFQGDEKALILFSTTVANRIQVNNIQNIAKNDKDKTDRKLLVSISRASEQFIILGNSDALKTAEAYQEILDETNGIKYWLDRNWAERLLQHKD